MENCNCSSYTCQNTEDTCLLFLFSAVTPRGPVPSESTMDLNVLVQGLMSFEEGVHRCNLCGKKSPWRTTMLRHVEANHIETAGHVCDMCGSVSKTRHAFNMHKKRRHPEFANAQSNIASGPQGHEAKEIAGTTTTVIMEPVGPGEQEIVTVVEQDAGTSTIVAEGASLASGREKRKNAGKNMPQML